MQHSGKMATEESGRIVDFRILFVALRKTLYYQANIYEKIHQFTIAAADRSYGSGSKKRLGESFTLRAGERSKDERPGCRIHG